MKAMQVKLSHSVKVSSSFQVSENRQNLKSWREPLLNRGSKVVELRSQKFNGPALNEHVYKRMEENNIISFYALT